MLPFRKILFPVDYSEPCTALIPYVRDMVEHFSAGLTAVHAFSLGSFATTEINMAEPGLLEECRQIETQRLTNFAAEAFSGTRGEHTSGGE